MKKSIKHAFTREQTGDAYWEWAEKHCKQLESGSYEIVEPYEANPDRLPESAGYFYQPDEDNTERLCMKDAMLKVLATLDPTSKKIVAAVANGKTIYEIMKNEHVSKAKVEWCVKKFKEITRKKAKLNYIRQQHENARNSSKL